MHRWLIDQDSSVSSEMPDGQGVWHYDDEVNICNTYLWIFFITLSPCFYILYILSSSTCHLNFVVVLLLLLF